MIDNDVLHQLQACIVEMERYHTEELNKLKANHNELKTYVRHLQGDEHSAHMINKRT